MTDRKPLDSTAFSLAFASYLAWFWMLTRYLAALSGFSFLVNLRGR